MKKKVMVLMTTAILAIGGISVAYAQGKDNMNSNKEAQVSYQTTSNYNNMIDLMKENGFSDAAKAMENRDFDAMNKFMNNLTDEDYNKMIDIMKNKGYASMAKMMESVSREDMINMHQTMMGR
ncbi:hypothetical protein [Clostridium sp. DJ247]|uniref:hypothetical protein n=1 Tax=Clostridium sp. DJ247 TaxID=2726188 RepID=UPI0016274FDF|nr:hypothetical protein [Clostridium sp. DJ247]MBC2582046.1 hypothetical protein [Clostridium sp. DJ247]